MKGHNLQLEVSADVILCTHFNSSEWRSNMEKRQDLKKMTVEATELINNTHQLVSGNLDIFINTQDYKLLGELANDINQISTTFTGYINEIAHILSHLSAGNMAVSSANDLNYKGDFVPIKNALHKIKNSLNHSFEEINIEKGLTASNNNLLSDWIEKFKTVTTLHELTETIQQEKYEYSRVKQTLIDRQLLLSNEIKILLEKTENRNNANSDVFVELETLKGQLENIIACIPPAKA